MGMDHRYGSCPLKGYGSWVWIMGYGSHVVPGYGSEPYILSRSHIYIYIYICIHVYTLDPSRILKKRICSEAEGCTMVCPFPPSRSGPSDWSHLASSQKSLLGKARHPARWTATKAQRDNMTQTQTSSSVLVLVGSSLTGPHLSWFWPKYQDTPRFWKAFPSARVGTLFLGHLEIPGWSTFGFFDDPRIMMNTCLSPQS